jgi:hypothetical protein
VNWRKLGGELQPSIHDQWVLTTLAGKAMWAPPSGAFGGVIVNVARELHEVPWSALIQNPASAVPFGNWFWGANYPTADGQMFLGADSVFRLAYGTNDPFAPADFTKLGFGALLWIEWNNGQDSLKLQVTGTPTQDTTHVGGAVDHWAIPVSFTVGATLPALNDDVSVTILPTAAALMHPGDFYLVGERPAGLSGEIPANVPGLSGKEVDAGDFLFAKDADRDGHVDQLVLIPAASEGIIVRQAGNSGPRSFPFTSRHESFVMDATISGAAAMAVIINPQTVTWSAQILVPGGAPKQVTFGPGQYAEIVAAADVTQIAGQGFVMAVHMELVRKAGGSYIGTFSALTGSKRIEGLVFVPAGCPSFNFGPLAAANAEFDVTWRGIA